MVIFYSGAHRPVDFLMIEALPPGGRSMMPTYHDVMPDGQVSEAGAKYVAQAMRMVRDAHILQRQHDAQCGRTDQG